MDGKKRDRLKRMVFGVVALTAFVTAFSAHADRPPPPRKNALLLTSYHTGYEWNDDLVHGVLDAFKESRTKASVFVECLDSQRGNPRALFAVTANYLKEKYRDTRFDVIVTIDDDALEMARQYRATLFPGVPLVACGVAKTGTETDETSDDTIILALTPDFASTLDLMLAIKPETRQVFAIGDASETGRAMARQFAVTAEKYRDRVHVVALDALPLKELRDKLRVAPKDAAALYLRYSQDQNGTRYAYDDAPEKLAAESAMPIFTVRDFGVGQGFLGGKVRRGRDEGAAAGKLAARLLNGENVRQVAASTSETPYRPTIFDFQALKRFHVPETALPRDAIILNKPYSYYEDNKVFFNVVYALLAILFLIVVSLSLTMVHRRRIERELETARDTLERRVLERTEELSRVNAWTLEQMRELEKAEDEVATLAKLSDENPNPVARFNTVGEVLYQNGPATELVAFCSNDVISEEKSKYEKAFQAAIENGSPRHLEIEWRHHIWFLEIVPVSEKGYVNLYGRDVTAHRMAEKTLILANRESEELNRKLTSNQAQLVHSEKMASLGQLAAGVAHEINNPVGFIKSNLGTLSDYIRVFNKRIEVCEEAVRATGREPPPRDKQLTFAIQDAAALLRESLEGTERVIDIVQNLKSFARLDESRLKQADLNEGIESALKIVWNELKYKCDVHKDLNPLPRISCYPGQLNQVFMNLLVNAAHAIEEKGVITVSTWADDAFIHIRVSDTGKGIRPEHIGKLFDPFFSTKEVGKGTGLGLSISHGIIEKHKGDIQVQSEWGKGSAFTVNLPREGVPDDGNEDHPVRG